jgi:hypothetical protein
MFSWKLKYNLIDLMKAEFPFIQRINLEDNTVVKCIVYISNFTMANGGRTSVTDHLQAKKHWNALPAKPVGAYDKVFS